MYKLVTILKCAQTVGGRRKKKSFNTLEYIIIQYRIPEPPILQTDIILHRWCCLRVFSFEFEFIAATGVNMIVSPLCTPTHIHRHRGLIYLTGI